MIIWTDWSHRIEEKLSFLSCTSVVLAVSIVCLDKELPAGQSGTSRFSPVTME